MRGKTGANTSTIVNTMTKKRKIASYRKQNKKNKRAKRCMSCSNCDNGYCNRFKQWCSSMDSSKCIFYKKAEDKQSV